MIRPAGDELGSDPGRPTFSTSDGISYPAVGGFAIPPPYTPCPGCGARTYDPGRFHAVYGLCCYCWADPDARLARACQLRLASPDETRPQPPEPCTAPPGSPLRQWVMEWRLENGYSLYHPGDAMTGEPLEAMEWDDPDVDDLPALPQAPPDRDHTARPNPDPIQPAEHIPGVELDRWPKRIVYRARPRWRGCRVNLGTFTDHHAAAEAIRNFYRQRLGLFAEYAPDHHRWYEGKALATVRTRRGWCDIDPLPAVPRAVQRQAVRTVTARTYCTCRAVREAFVRAVQAEAA